MKFLQDYIRTLLASGKYFFTKHEAISQLGLTPTQFKFQAYRLSKKKLIKRLIRDFFMIIPDEYRNLGSLPPSWAADPLMKYLRQEYYIGLLSAAAMYAATEQQPMSLQVITNKRTKSIHLPRGSIEFHFFKGCSNAQKVSINVYTGSALISSREQTMLDLIRFYKASGYLSNVSAVIKVLAEECNPMNLREVIHNEKTTSILQRLGYILEFVGLSNLAAIIEDELRQRKLKYIPFRPDFHSKEGAKLRRWKLILNKSLELT